MATRASLNYVPWKVRKQAVADLQLIYRPATATEAERHLTGPESKWKTYPSLSQVGRLYRSSGRSRLRNGRTS